MLLRSLTLGASSLLAKQGKSKFFAGTLRLKDGEEFLVEIRITPLDDGGG